MSSLQALQQRMQQAVLADKPARLDDIQGDASADAQARLGIYRHGYRARLRDALASEFSGLRCLAGRRFNALLDRYIDAHPSTHYNIRWHGAGLAAFLGYAQPWLERSELADMARLDWAISTAFDAADEACVAPADLAAVPPERWVSLSLQPQIHLQILTLSCNADAFRRAADQSGPRPHLRRFRHPQHLLVWRQALAVRYRWLADDERQLLSGATRGETVATLCDRLAGLSDTKQAMPRLATLLHGWLEAGLIRSWSLDG